MILWNALGLLFLSYVQVLFTIGGGDGPMERGHKARSQPSVNINHQLKVPLEKNMPIYQRCFLPDK